jgi:hypothetical protein
LAETVSKPDGQPAIWATYRNIDTTSKAAANRAGIASADAKPCAPALYPADPTTRVRVPGPAAPGRAVPGRALRFRSLPGGFRLLSDGDLPAGMLSVYDTRGRLAFASRYDAAASAWSPGAAHGLPDPLYAYAFRGTDGSVRAGRIALPIPR